jgi:hypothetical protein
VNVENLIGSYIAIGKYRIASGATVVVPDIEYNQDDILAAIINSAYAAGTIDVTSPPSGFPRSGVHTGENSQDDDEDEIVPPVTPPVDGYLAWYDAADLDTVIIDSSDPDGCWVWLDKSGNLFHASQGNTGSRPTTGTRTINSLNVLDFDGDDHMETAVPADDRTQTSFFVAMIDSLAAYRTLRGGTSGNGNQLRIDQTTGQLTTNKEGTAGIGTQGNASVTASVPFLAVQVLTATDVTHYRGATSETDSNSTTFDSGRVMRIGGKGDFAERWDGVMAEIIIYPTALSSEDITSVSSYLVNKWGL